MWHVADAEFPVDGTTRQRLGFVAKYAYLAPIQSDWHPWEIVLGDSHLDLLLKTEGELDDEASDPRELMIRCGVALQYLKVALKHFGSLGRIEKFPDLDRRSLVARIHFGFGRERDARETSLFEAITASRDQQAFSGDGQVPADTQAALGQAVAVDRAWLEWSQSDVSRQRVLEFTLASDATHRFASMAFTLGVIKTKTDDEHGWLAAGQAVALAILHAHAWGLGWSFFHRMPDPDAREALRMGVGQKGFAQLVMHFSSIVPRQAIPFVSTTSTATFN